MRNMNRYFVKNGIKVVSKKYVSLNLLTFENSTFTLPRNEASLFFVSAESPQEDLQSEFKEIIQIEIF